MGSKGQKTNYFKIGVFVITTVTMIIIGIILFSAGAIIRDVVLVETYIDQSVQGLNVGSAVMQRGVQIGRVEKITFVAKHYGTKGQEAAELDLSKYVMVLVGINKSSFPNIPEDEEKIPEVFQKMIDKGFRIKVVQKGITGIAYLEADYIDPERYPPLDIVTWEPENIYIPWAPGTLASFTQSLDTILQKVEKIEFKKISDSLDGMLKTIRKAVNEAEIAEVRGRLLETLEEIKKSNRDIQAIMDESAAKDKNKTIPQAVASFNAALNRIDTLLASQQLQMERISENIYQASKNLNELSASLKDNPSQLIMGSAPPKTETVK
jgi:phospholipid/cholesterol/gamma-HCH transport system substrate-binding protein/paraquat-inducible protein B